MMLERLTFLLGLCVTAIGWLFAYIIADITSSPVLYYSISPAVTAPGGAVSDVTIHNLSRHLAAPAMKLLIQGKSAAGAGCISTIPDVAGRTWTLSEPAPAYNPNEKSIATVSFDQGITPNAQFVVHVPLERDCQMRVLFDLSNGAKEANVPASNTRILTDGWEAFTIGHYFAILLSLLGLFTVSFIFTFVRAYRLSRSKP